MTKRTWIATAAVAALLAWAVPATPAQAYKDRMTPSQGDFMVRILGAAVVPDTDVDSIRTNGVLTPGADADVTDAYVPATTLTYFFTPNIAAELFCCVAEHEIDGEGTFAALGELAETWIFPPTLTLQYHFTGSRTFKPYVGAGVTYIAFFDEDVGSGLTGVATGVDIDDAWGFALQAGVDIALGGNWHFNADVKKIFLNTDVTWQLAGGGNIVADVDLDPWVFSAGFGYRFHLADLFGGGGARHEPLK